MFDGGPRWHWWARLAIYEASRRWGGAGFILVPHSSAQVSDALLQVVSAYDPDHVVLFRMSAGQYEAAFPGKLKLSSPDGTALSGQARLEMLSQMRDVPLDDQNGELARKTVAEACTPFRRRHGEDPRWHEMLTHLDTTGQDRRLTPIGDLPNAADGPCIAAPADWGGAFGVAVAARCGLLEEPHCVDDPPLDEEGRQAAVSWLLASPRAWHPEPPGALIWHPAAAMSVSAHTLPMAFDRTTYGLTSVRSGFEPNQPTVFVVGDAASDFALALAWDRLAGPARWLPDQWSPAGSSPVTLTARLVLEGVVDAAVDELRPVHVVTTSATEREVQAVAEALRSRVVRFVDDDLANADAGVGGGGGRGDLITTDALPFPRSGLTHLAVSDQFDQQYALPVYSDGLGTLTLAAPPPPPAIANPELSAVELRYVVDLEIGTACMPRGRGVDSGALVAPGEDPYLTWVRSARDGISYSAQRWNFVSSGTPAISRLARPRLRHLGLLPWIQAMAATQPDCSVRLSDAGRRAEILSRLWGSRDRMVTDMAGPLLSAFRAFRSKARSSSSSYPDGHGVVVDGEGLLTFAGITANVRDLQQTGQLRAEVDRLLTLRVLRRGIVTDCGECGRVAFVSVDRLSQRNECLRCGATSELTQARWRQPDDEPRWYYDLHGAVRELLAQNGEVPLLLGQHLRGDGRRVVDIAEVELVRAEQPVAEADLVALCDQDLLITAEAKSVNFLGEHPRGIRRAAAKRVQIAAALGADQIVLATTASDWKASSVTAVCDAVGQWRWSKGLPPAVRLITGLGGTEVRDELARP